MIVDAAFYALAVPAALLVGLGKSGLGGGMGMLAVPMIALAVPVPQAAAIVLPLLTVGDLFGLAALIRERDRAVLRVLLPSGLFAATVTVAPMPSARCRTMARPSPVPPISRLRALSTR